MASLLARFFYDRFAFRRNSGGGGIRITLSVLAEEKAAQSKFA
jgi:hypothetical protein